jgi:uncharacterized membrane protein YecN with MAPEG domain
MFFSAARFLLVLPVNLFVVLALINFLVIAVLVIALRNAYRNGKISDSSKEATRTSQRIFALWAGLIVWCLIFINALRLVNTIPLAAFAIGSLIDLGLVGTFAVALRKAYRQDKPQTSQG